MPAERDELFEAIYECWIGREYTPASTITSTERGRINRAAQELRKIGATADDIRVRWEAMRAKWPNLSLTPQALTGNWSTIVVAPVSQVDRWMQSRR